MDDNGLSVLKCCCWFWFLSWMVDLFGLLCVSCGLFLLVVLLVQKLCGRVVFLTYVPLCSCQTCEHCKNTSYLTIAFLENPQEKGETTTRKTLKNTKTNLNTLEQRRKTQKTLKKYHRPTKNPREAQKQTRSKPRRKAVNKHKLEKHRKTISNKKQIIEKTMTIENPIKKQKKQLKQSIEEKHIKSPEKAGRNGKNKRLWVKKGIGTRKIH